MYSGVYFVTIMIIAYSFEKILSENANFRLTMLINAFSLLMGYGIMLIRQNFGECPCIFTFWYNLRYIYCFINR